MVKSHEMDSFLKFIFLNPNGFLTSYSMYPQGNLCRVVNFLHWRRHIHLTHDSGIYVMN